MLIQMDRVEIHIYKQRDTVIMVQNFNGFFSINKNKEVHTDGQSKHRH